MGRKVEAVATLAAVLLLFTTAVMWVVSSSRPVGWTWCVGRNLPCTPVPSRDYAVPPPFDHHRFDESVSVVIWRGRMVVLDVREAWSRHGGHTGLTTMDHDATWSGGWVFHPFGRDAGSAMSLSWLLAKWGGPSVG